ncbi:MAG: peptide ABC transporter substrate-binding protein [Bacillota bacterium]|nr:peptide ABC transporter substrate-binding protein [Bacillota bacterium]
MKRKVAWLAWLLVVAMVGTVVVTGCAKKPAEPEKKPPVEQVLNLNLGEEPPDLDANTSTDQVSFEILNNVMEGLVRVGAGEKIEKGSGLALDWTVSDDGMKYTFKLRDARWSDDKPVTAYDFEYGWKRALDPNTGSQYAYIMYPVKGAEALNSIDPKAPDSAAKIEAAKAALGVKALDEKTLEVTLESPTPYFISLMAFPTYYPIRKDIIEKFADAYAAEPDKMVYCGPFVIQEWQHESKLVLAKNPKYWDADKVKLSRIEFVMIKDHNAYMNMFEAGELDGTGVPGDFIQKYKDAGNLQTIPEAVTWYILFNLKSPVFKNKNMRKAFSLAIDRQDFVDKVLKNMSLPATSYTPPSITTPDGKSFAKDMVGELIPKKADPAAAKAALQQGMKELKLKKLPKIVFLSSDSSVAKKYAAAWQEMWKQNLGVEVQVDAVAFKVRIDRMSKGDYDVCMAGWGADFNDPMTFIDMWVTGGGNNDAGYSNPKYDQLVKEAKATGDQAIRFRNMLECEKIIAEDLPIAPVWWPVWNFVEKPYLKGVIRHPVGPDLDWKYVTVEGKPEKK